MTDTTRFDDLYQAFMDAVLKAENSSGAARKRWIKTARAEYAEMQEHAEQYSAAVLRRAKRTWESLDDLAA
jgi:hypothetical protein